MVWKTKIVDKLGLVEIFIGAFLSSILTFVSFGCFLRLGWILSVSGVQLLSSVCLFATFISGITAFSISWMLSNIKIKNDSLYFLLSRIFGVDVAFSVSLPLFISQALSASFYVLGVAEVLNCLFPFLNTSFLIWFLFAALGFVTLLKYDYLLKSELLVFLLVISLLITIFFNPLLIPSTKIKLRPNFGFWETFALFYPLITGIESILGNCDNKKFSH